MFAGVLGLCGIPAGKNLPYLGALITAASPVNLLWAIIYPASTIEKSLMSSVAAGRTWMVMGAALAAIVYGAVVLGMHTNMKRGFMMTVRKLAGTN